LWHREAFHELRVQSADVSAFSGLYLSKACLQPLSKISEPPNHQYKRFSKDFCTQKMKANKTMKGQAISNHRRRKGKKVESNIYSATHNQTLNQQRQLHDRDHHILIKY
jgi:hypothetical protein